MKTLGPIGPRAVGERVKFFFSVLGKLTLPREALGQIRPSIFKGQQRKADTIKIVFTLQMSSFLPGPIRPKAAEKGGDKRAPGERVKWWTNVF